MGKKSQPLWLEPPPAKAIYPNIARATRALALAHKFATVQAIADALGWDSGRASQIYRWAGGSQFPGDDVLEEVQGRFPDEAEMFGKAVEADREIRKGIRKGKRAQRAPATTELQDATASFDEKLDAREARILAGLLERLAVLDWKTIQRPLARFVEGAEALDRAVRPELGDEPGSG